MNWQKYFDFNYVASLGIEEPITSEESRKSVFNKVVAISLVTYILFIPIAVLVSSVIYFLIILITAFVLMFCLWLSKMKLFLMSQVVFLFTLIVSIGLISDLLGASTAVSLCLVPISILPLLYLKSPYYALFPWSICVVLFFYFTNSNDVFFTEIEIKSWKVSMLYFSIFFGVVIVGYYYNAFFKLSSDENDRKLIIVNREISYRNDEILKNIELARSIQANLLPFDSYFTALFPKSFVFYQPRDIVSGDFYWVDKINERKYCAVIDCTGHGVPGAFVSILGHQGLNRCLQDFALTEPSDILNKLHEIMYNVLRKEDSLIIDGMDMSLTSLDMEKSELTFSGAHNSVLLVRDNEFQLEGFEADYRGINDSLYKIVGQRQSVGSDYLTELFVQQVIKVRPKDRLYFYTDGYIDQFGGPKQKKIMHKQFKKLLLSLQSLSMEEQNAELKNFFRNWKGETSQIDDVCVIGIEI